MKPQYPIYLAGTWQTTANELPVTSPYSGAEVTKTYLASTADLEKAIQAGLSVQDEAKHLPTHVRAAALLHIANRMKERKEEFATAMVAETAKPIVYARVEVDRAVQTFIDGAEEAKRMYGEWMALDRTPAGNNHEAIVRRFPIGLVAAIAPFNFPLNLVAHKLAPAIAAGCPIILKPASKTPISALLLAELIDEVTAHTVETPLMASLQSPRSMLLPKGMVSILPMDRETGDMMVTDDRFKLLTFTGSPTVGWDMKSRAGKKKVVLELGGNAGLIVTPSAHLELAVKKSVVGAFSFSGQSCIHTQRIYVHESIFDAFVSKFVEETKKLVYGDPADEKTQVSAMIDGKNSTRIDEWVREAVLQGATLLWGGKKVEVAGYEPTVLTNTTIDMKICSEEAFAPIVILEKYYKFSDALEAINSSKFGLQAGVFTDSMKEVMTAYDTLDVGGVVINDVPTFRADHMPYGGVKDSGIGREGVRYAIEDMTEVKTLVINNR